jgi:hypothetical protein
MAVNPVQVGRLRLLHHKAILDEGAIVEHAAIRVARLHHSACMATVL